MSCGYPYCGGSNCECVRPSDTPAAADLRTALTNLVNAFHEGRATHAQPEAAGYVRSLVSAAEEALQKRHLAETVLSADVDRRRLEVFDSCKGDEAMMAKYDEARADFTALKATQLNVVLLSRPKRLNDFKDEVTKLIDSKDFGNLTIAETVGVLQIVIMDLWRRQQEGKI